MSRRCLDCDADLPGPRATGRRRLRCDTCHGRHTRVMARLRKVRQFERALARLAHRKTQP